MRFTALVVVGDRNGHVGAGLGRQLRFQKQYVRVKKMPLKINQLPIDETVVYLTTLSEILAVPRYSLSVPLKVPVLLLVDLYVVYLSLRV